jgi:ribonuclease E
VTGDEGLPVPAVNGVAEAAAVAALSVEAVITAPEPVLEEAAPVARVQAAMPALVAAPAPAARVEAYSLPLDDLRSVATAAGLEWVNSDADKVRVAQEAIANAPSPNRVPREPKPVAALDDGPLVLVETRKDLAQFKLPFSASVDAPTLAQQQQQP